MSWIRVWPDVESKFFDRAMDMMTSLSLVRMRLLAAKGQGSKKVHCKWT